MDPGFGFAGSLETGSGRMWVLKNRSGFRIKFVPVRVEPGSDYPGSVWVRLPSLLILSF